MVEIQITKDKEDNITLRLDGHADYDPGNDIVCSAVSTLVYTLSGALQNISPTNFSSRMKKGNAIISFDLNNKNETIFETVYIGLLQIEKKYPENVDIQLINV